MDPRSYPQTGDYWVRSKTAKTTADCKPKYAVEIHPPGYPSSCTVTLTVSKAEYDSVEPNDLVVFTFTKVGCYRGR